MGTGFLDAMRKRGQRIIVSNIRKNCVLTPFTFEQQDKTRFDRSHFKEYGDFALVFESVYYVPGPDYNEYMDIPQAINLHFHQRFEQESIALVDPTQTLLVQEPQK